MSPRWITSGLIAAMCGGAFASEACGASNDATVTGRADGADAGSESGAATNVQPTEPTTRFDQPLAELSDAERAEFNRGDELFGSPFREPDGLGPLYVRVACAACHEEALRGPGLVQKMVVVGIDGKTPLADQSALAYGNTLRTLLAAGATTPVPVPPIDPAVGTVRVSTRLGPPLLGRGYMEAVLDSEIERMEREQAGRADGIHGHVHRVSFLSEPNPDTRFHSHKKGDTGLVGRFGVKARLASIDEFVADAFQGDMGITSPMRPNELPNPDGLTDDRKPGVDTDMTTVNGIASYMRMIAIPRRGELDEQGRILFERAACAACHQPSLRTRADYPIGAVANQDAAIYTDMLLHDMGDDLADSMLDGTGPRDFRTAPLIGLRFLRSFLHDGRATTIEDAIQRHAGPGSEANVAVDAYRQFTKEEQNALLQFVSQL
jgi:CxxC motif-containing protein (DUF1111 family)